MMHTPHITRLGEGQTLRLGAPMAGELLLKVDAQQSGQLITTAIQTLLPGSSIPVHRHRFIDRSVFLHKGQARVTIDTQSMTIVPGTLVTVPRNTWFGLRNNGTGTLEVTWTCVPGGLEAFYQEFAAQHAASDEAVMVSIGQRFGLEFSPAGEPAQPAAGGPPSRRRRRGGRGRGPDRGGRVHEKPAGEAGAHAGESSEASTHPHELSSAGTHDVDAAGPATQMTASPEAQPASGGTGPGEARPPRERQGPGRHGPRRHRPPRGRGAPNRQPSGVAKPVSGAATTAPGAPAAQGPAAAGGRSSAGGRGRRDRGGSRHRRVREVYMGGRWVKVSGEGPVIFHDQSKVRKPKDDDEDSLPSTPFPI